MTGLFLTLASFMLNPTFNSQIPINGLPDNVVIGITKTLEKSNIEKECTTMYLNGYNLEKGLLSYTTYCFKNNIGFKAIVGIDINNLIWLRIRK